MVVIQKVVDPLQSLLKKCLDVVILNRRYSAPFGKVAKISGQIMHTLAHKPCILGPVLNMLHHLF